jgi:hypothetical protein
MHVVLYLTGQVKSVPAVISPITYAEAPRSLRSAATAAASAGGKGHACMATFPCLACQPCRRHIHLLFNRLHIADASVTAIMDAAVLQHLHAAVRGAGGCGGGSAASAAFDCAAAQLQVLGAPAMRHAGAADLAGEFLERAEQLVGSKQVRGEEPMGRWELHSWAGRP